ncbi:hypothetical protein BCR42DRAFT_427224 [Absidia repens]|uniref:Membrane anchor Opy2 N-terminal domain-containing protein n=1 Tax=Absidia repens TaxID=90262 RepID=A0A1X2I0I7_9FUNG|nr:hypothetical protein BCR42DRAFT_427224 [Absidia repens]
MLVMNKPTFYLSILIAFLWIIVACHAAEPTESSDSSAAPSASGSASGSQKCPPIACTQPSGKPKCPSECADACHFEADKCCPAKQIGVCSSSATASGGPAASGSSSTAAATSGAATSSASAGGASSAASGSGSASTASPSTSAGVSPIRNISHAYYVFGILCVGALYLI